MTAFSARSFRDCPWERRQRWISRHVLLPTARAAGARARQVLKAEKVDAVVVSLLHSYAHPRMRKEILAILTRPSVLGGRISSRASPRSFTIERTSTAVVQATQPLVSRYDRNCSPAKAVGVASRRCSAVKAAWCR